MINQKGEVVNQEVHLVDRAKGYVTGVLDVVSFDLESVVIGTNMIVEKINNYKNVYEGMRINEQK